MSNFAKISFCVLAVVLTVALVSCGEIGDPRYNGWAKYTDKADGYSLFVPPEWNVSDFNIPGMRGSRFYNEIMYTGDRSAFVYFAVIVRDEEDTTLSLEKTGRQEIALFTEGIWKNLKIQTSGESSETQTKFHLSGEPYYSSYKLKGEVHIYRIEGKLYYLVASGTSAAFSELKPTYDKIFQGFQP